MNHKQRVLAAINHKKADRPAYDFWAEPAALERMFHFVGHRDLEKLLLDLDVDIRHVEAKMPDESFIDGAFQNFWGERYLYKDSEWGPVREDLPGALSNAQSIEDLESFNWPCPDSFDYSNLKTLCESYDGFAIMYGFADIWERPALVRGLENALMDLVLNPEWVHFLARKFTDFYKKDYSNAYQASDGKIDIFLILSDLGSQSGPFMSVDMFDEFVAPYLKELVGHIHSLGAYAMFHSCGAIHPLIERFIEIRVDILDPIQPAHPEMKSERLFDKFGGRICFHGGIDIQHVLPHGTEEQVMEEVKHYASILGKNGGYICSPAHLFQPDIPPQNVFAFYKALATIK